jgi:hypothetical protein
VSLRRDLAEAAYRAYGEVTGFKNHQGGPMPDFGDLPGLIQQAWEAAAVAALSYSSPHVPGARPPRF